MRLLLLCLVLTSTVAYADDEDDAFVALPKRSVGVALVGHGSRIGDRSEGGFGPAFEIALGRGRWQYFAEGAYASASMSTWTTSALDMHVDGRMLRGGGGVRWLARQMRDDAKTGGIEMYVLSLVGAERFYMNDGMRLTRPEVALGFGVQARLFKRPLCVRMDARVVFTQDATPGFMGGTGLAW